MKDAQFSNRYWFQEVTNQDQGIEIFKLYKKSFEFEIMYKQIKEEIDRGDEYLNTLQQIEFNKFTTKVSIVGFFIGLFAIIVGFFGINFKFFGLANKDISGLLWCALSILSILFLIYAFKSSIFHRKRGCEYLVSSFYRLKRWWANIKTRLEQ